METIRMSPVDSVFPILACSRCGDASRPWDRIAGKTFCPSCLEALAVGEADAVVARVDKRRCSICQHQGTVRYLTFPLNSRRPVEIDLCGEHLRCLIGRRLGPHGFDQLRQQLRSLGLNVGAIFLLHDAFYDDNGRALQPATDLL